MSGDAFILDAVRTPFGRAGGALAGVRPDDLGAHAVRALLERVVLNVSESLRGGVRYRALAEWPLPGRAPDR